MLIILCLLFQQKLAKREAGTIDRSQDIARLQDFYKLYREKHNVDRLREEEKKLRESGAFSENLSEYVYVFEEEYIAHVDDFIVSLYSPPPLGNIAWQRKVYSSINMIYLIINCLCHMNFFLCWFMLLSLRSLMFELSTHYALSLHIGTIDKEYLQKTVLCKYKKHKKENTYLIRKI